MAKIEDQVIVVDALREKSYHEQAYHNPDNNPDLYQMYKKRYSELYFGDKNESKSDWKTYNSYLKELISKNKQINSRLYTELPPSADKRNN